MHYNVITKHHQNRERWITFWEVEVIEDGRKTVYHFGGHRCLERYLDRLKLKIAEQSAKRQAQAKATVATLKKRHYQTWWKARVDRKTGRVQVARKGQGTAVSAGS